MNTLIAPKLNQLFTSWPQNLVATSPWLHAQGIDNNLIRKYVASHWLTRVGNGAFIRTGDKPDWSSALYALQSQLKLDVHAGGATALELDGVYNQVPMQTKQRRIYIYGHQGTKLPKWFTHGSLKTNPVFSKIELFTSEPAKTFRESPKSEFPIKTSTRERAILELLDSANPDGLELISALFPMLSGLRAQVIQQHLELCTSVKVKRLFLYLAREENAPWFKDLDLEKINLGLGNRVFTKHGSLDPQFKITVPKTEKNYV